jgi:hypothetical protein
MYSTIDKSPTSYEYIRGAHASRAISLNIIVMYSDGMERSSYVGFSKSLVLGAPWSYSSAFQRTIDEFAQLEQGWLSKHI